MLEINHFDHDSQKDLIKDVKLSLSVNVCFLAYTCILYARKYFCLFRPHHQRPNLSLNEFFLLLLLNKITMSMGNVKLGDVVCLFKRAKIILGENNTICIYIQFYNYLS